MSPAKRCPRFDLWSAIPENARIVSATLYLHPAFGSTAFLSNLQVDVYPVGDAWTTFATWSSPDGVGSWSQPRGAFGGASLVPTEPTQLSAAGSLFWADLSDMVRSWTRGLRPPDGLVLSAHRRPQVRQATTDTFGSLETSGRAPYVEIVHEPRVDDTRPELDVEGDLLDAAGYVGRGTYGLTVTANDTADDADPEDQISGSSASSCAGRMAASTPAG